MDWKTLFLDANGRIGQKDFWIGWLIVFAGGLVLGMIPLIGFIASIASIYFNVCIFSKRLHDFGKTGWLYLAPIGVAILGVIIIAVTGGLAVFTASITGNDAAAAGAGVGAMAIAGIVGLAIMVVSIGFLLWVGLTKGDIGANRYGEPRIQPLITFV